MMIWLDTSIVPMPQTQFIFHFFFGVDGIDRMWENHLAEAKISTISYLCCHEISKYECQCVPYIWLGMPGKVNYPLWVFAPSSSPKHTRMVGKA